MEAIYGRREWAMAARGGQEWYVKLAVFVYARFAD
jgi:hypothetical protein